MLAGELARLLDQHPSLRLAAAVSRRGLGLGQLHPQLPAGSKPVRTVPPAGAAERIGELLSRSEPTAVAFALPHGESPAAWARLRSELGERADDLSVVDLAADFRLRDADLYRRTYGAEHPEPEALARFVYGLPEHRRAEIRGARRVAVPGCFATALQLGVLPAAEAGLLDAAQPWILNAVTGSSGSGIEPKPGTHHPHRHGNLWAYALEGHRHEAELAQALRRVGIEAALHFVPHSGPFARGIHLTAALPLARRVATSDVREIYARAYAGEPFIDVLEQGVPDLRTVVGSNRAALATSVRGEMLTVLVTLDNLIKGGAGQALQCLNLMLGFPETCGLPRAGLGVV
jgi:N-acetyl-gamma-glutamyl-phosphate reductase